MRLIEGEKYYSIQEVADMLGRQAQTIKNWYQWYENAATEEEKARMSLPGFRQDVDNKGTRYFTADAIDQLDEFKKQVGYGTLAEWNRKRWGKRIFSH